MISLLSPKKDSCCLSLTFKKMTLWSCCIWFEYSNIFYRKASPFVMIHVHVFNHLMYTDRAHYWHSVLFKNDYVITNPAQISLCNMRCVWLPVLFFCLTHCSCWLLYCIRQSVLCNCDSRDPPAQALDSPGWVIEDGAMLAALPQHTSPCCNHMQSSHCQIVLCLVA